MAGKDVRAGNAYVELGLKSKVDAGLQAVSRRLKAFGASAMAIGGGITAAVSAAFGSVMYSANSFANAGDAIGKMAARTGIGVEALQELSFAAGQSGTDIETVEAATRKMSKVVTDSINGLKGPAEALRSIGIDPQQLAGQSVEDQFQAIADSLGQVDNATRKAALAQEIFGKSGTQLLPMLNGGRNGIAALRKEARELGFVMSAENVKAAEALTDAFGRFTAATTGFANLIGSLAAKPLTALTTGLSKVVSMGTRFVDNNKDLILTVAKVAAGVGAVAAAFGGIGAAALTAGILIPIIAPAVSAAVAALMGIVAPAAIAIGAIASIGAIIWLNRERIISWAKAFWEAIAPVRDAVGQLLAIVDSTFGGVLNALYAGEILLAIEILWSGAKTLFFEGAAAAVDAFFWLYGQGVETFNSLTSYVSEWATNLFAPIVPALQWVSSVLSTVFGDTFDYVRDLISSFVGDTLNVFGAMGKAIAGGNLSLAFEILWASAKLAFESGIGTVRKLWSGFTTGLSEVWQTLSHTIVSVFRTSMQLIARVMETALTQLSKAASAVAEYDPTGIAQKVSDSLGSVASIYSAADRGLAADQEAADARRLAAQIANGQASLDAEKKINADIAKSRAERDALIDAANASDGFEGFAALGQRERAKLELLIEKAQNAAAAAGGDSGDDNTGKRSTRANVGSFSAVGAVLMGMGAGSNVQDKIAKHAEKTEKNTAQTAAALKDVAVNLRNLPPVPTFV